jgi:glycerophosphoryl diester phosphodiesterase
MSANDARRRPLLLGHRGQRHLRRNIIRDLRQQVLPPDNTLAAFELSMERGCDGFEFDVRFTHDRRGVICHDPDYSGLIVANSQYDTLRAASAKQERRQTRSPDAQMPCLEEVLARFSGRAYLDIEIKIPGFEEDVVNVIQQHPPSRSFVISSFLAEVLERFHELDPELPLGFICSDRKLLPKWQRLPVDIVIPNISLVTEPLVREWQAVGKQVFVWTVNRESEMRLLASWGVDGIISDDTELLVRIFGYSQGKSALLS